MPSDRSRQYWWDYQTEVCPLCGRKEVAGELCRLYDTWVCADCRGTLSHRRQAAFILDLLLFLIAGNGIRWSIQLAGGGAIADAPFMLAWLLLFFLKDGYRGTSPGKWLLDLQVVDDETLRPAGPWASLKRNLIFLLCPIPFVLLASDLPTGRRWGDRWAKTIVIWRRYADRIPFDRPMTLCRRCGYDLTGNNSGVCPECSYMIPAHDRRAITAKGLPSAPEPQG